MGLIEYFNSEYMNKHRQTLLAGEDNNICRKCYYEDEFNKTSARAKQLYRAKIAFETFEEDYEKSQYRDAFEASRANGGKTDLLPFDLQFDLGNLCNSACIMCNTSLSSRLRSDFVSITKAGPDPLFPIHPQVKPWVDEPEFMNKILNDLDALPYIDYLHFLGGEPMIIEGFYSICERLIENGKSKDILLGATTNCTKWDDRMERFAAEYRGFHMGLSIESTSTLNEYVRYPSKNADVFNVFNKFMDLRSRNDEMFLLLLIAPNIFTIYYFDQMIDFMVENRITAESCEILNYPSYLRMELLPEDLRRETIAKLYAAAAKHGLTKTEKVVDTRNKKLYKEVMSNVIFDYIHFLENYSVPADVNDQRRKLVEYLMKLEAHRGNCILDHAPDFDAFLRSYGYERPVII